MCRECFPLVSYFVGWTLQYPGSSGSTGKRRKRRTAWRPTHESAARSLCGERRPLARCLLGAAFRAVRSRPGCAARHPALWQGAAVHFSERPRAERRAGAGSGERGTRRRSGGRDLPQCERRSGQDFPALGRSRARSLEAEHCEHAIARAQESPARIDAHTEEGPVLQIADAYRVHRYRHLRASRVAVSPKHEHQRLARGRGGALRILGVNGRRGKRPQEDTEQEGAAHRKDCAQLIHGWVSMLFFSFFASPWTLRIRRIVVSNRQNRKQGGSIPDIYEVFAIKYASLSNRKASENFIGGDPHESASDLDYLVWLARSKARAFVIDTGFDARVRARPRRIMLHQAP